jgi:hypothetical protein
MAPSYLAAAALVLVVALAPPLTAGDVLANFCGAIDDIYYVANRSYHNNLQRLAATLPANAFSSPALYVRHHCSRSVAGHHPHPASLPRRHQRVRL